jgi:hypothetical protein
MSHPHMRAPIFAATIRQVVFHPSVSRESYNDNP